jgi:hypothetical protein
MAAARPGERAALIDAHVHAPVLAEQHRLGESEETERARTELAEILVEACWRASRPFHGFTIAPARVVCVSNARRS